MTVSLGIRTTGWPRQGNRCRTEVLYSLYASQGLDRHLLTWRVYVNMDKSNFGAARYRVYVSARDP